MKKIIILGAGEYQVPLIKKAKEMGLYTIVVSPKGEYPGLYIADKVYFFDVRDKTNILKIAQKEKINGITTDQTDLPVSTVAYVAEKLSLPGIGYEVSRLFTDKYLMREKCKSIGISTAIYRLVNSINKAKKFCDDIGYPVVLKPVDNQGSRGVYKIYNEFDLGKYFSVSQKYSLNQDILLEEFIDGDEFIVDSLVVDNRYQNLLIGDSYFFNFKNKFIPNKRLFPTICKADIANRLLEIDEKIIRNFGIKQGITFAEYKIDKKTNNIYLIEIAARGQAIYISSHVIPELKNFDVSAFILSNALGEKVNTSIDHTNQMSTGYVAFYFPAGKIVELNGIEDLENIKNVLKHNLHSIKKNQLVARLEDKTARKIIIIKSTNRKELDVLNKKLKELLKIKVLTKEGLKGIIWD